MMFEDFAKAHGLIIRGITSHRWVATPTTDHPHSKNGRYKFMGDVGWVQNWATMDKPSIWKTDQKFVPSQQFKRDQDNALRERRELAEKASAKAGWIMHQTELTSHPYLIKKGFPEERMAVWNTPEGEGKLVIPMRRNNKIVGCQLINEEGEKKFLYGQTSKGATLTLDAKGVPIFCEGLATGLSIQAVMRSNKMRYSIHVCFSAGNMKEVAREFSHGIIIADHDNSGVGQRIAHEAGKPYWLSDTVGEDFNDYHMRVGLFKASQSLKKFVVDHREALPSLSKI
jgi:putative DNA primase/helicase